MLHLILGFALGGATALCVGWLIGRPARMPVLRSGKRTDAECIADLDALVTETVQFFWRGRYHDIPPITTESFFKAMNALAELDILRNEKKVKDVEQLEQAYAAYFAIVCPSIGLNELQAMQHPQMGALMKLTQDAIIGKAQVEAQKKRAKSEENRQGSSA